VIEKFAPVATLLMTTAAGVGFNDTDRSTRRKMRYNMVDKDWSLLWDKFSLKYGEKTVSVLLILTISIPKTVPVIEPNPYYCAIILTD